MITLIVISIISAILSGFSKAVCDNSEESRLPFYKKTFWIKDLSWQNKWKNGDRKQGEKFFLSSTALVMLTDAWHLFGMLFRVCFATTYVCIGLLANQSYFYLFGTLVAYILFALSFHLFYNSKLLRK